MNVAAHLEKEKNEETRKGKREAEEERRHATDFKEAVCCPIAVVQAAAWQKCFAQGNARGNWDPPEDQQSFRPKPNGIGDRITTLRRLLIGTGLLFLHILLLFRHNMFSNVIMLSGTIW